MIENQASVYRARPQVKKVSVQERSVHVGDFIVINGYHTNHAALKNRFTEGGYQIYETPHFLVFTRTEAPSTILVHWFAPQQIDADVGHYLVQELKALGIIQHWHHLSELFTGIVGGALFPDDIRRAWNYFGANTLQRLLLFLSSASTPAIPDYGTMSAAALLYQRVSELCVGDRFLDAACNGGFLSLLLAERRPFVVEAVGVDIDEDVFVTAQELAKERGLTNVRFAQADLLADDFCHIGQFDTVTALHVLEHFSEQDMYLVLKNLLEVSLQRLIVAVPYEQGKPEVAYSHLQHFSRPKLEAIGEWCIQQLQGKARMWYEDFIGGLLLIERYPL